MNATNLLPGLTSSKITTARLGTHLLASGTPGLLPRRVMNQFYFKPPFRVSHEREDVFVGSVREEILPGVGHSPHLEAPEAFRALLFSFLQQLK